MPPPCTSRRLTCNRAFRERRTDEEFARIEAELANITIHGNRTDEYIAKLRQLD